jgi:hypothetical protein
LTIAVCLHCGELKHGAFKRCPKCGYTPNDDESLTKHLLVTDHFHRRETLEAIAARVKSGQPIEFDPEALREAWVSKEQLDAETKQLDAEIKRLGRGSTIGCGIVIALAVAAVVALLSRLNP